MIYYTSKSNKPSLINPAHIVSAVELTQGLRIELTTGSVMLEGWTIEDLSELLEERQKRIQDPLASR